MPLRIAVVEDHDLVVAGVTGLLAGVTHRLEVAGRIIAGRPVPGGAIDVALIDTYGSVGLAADIPVLVAAPDIDHVVLFSLHSDPLTVETARRAGAHGFASKAWDAEQIAEAIVNVAAGRSTFALAPSDVRAPCRREWPGRTRGLSERESQVLVLLGEGLSNNEIAAHLRLRLETVKSHVSTILRKIGARNRVQAAAWVSARVHPGAEAAVGAASLS